MFEIIDDKLSFSFGVCLKVEGQYMVWGMRAEGKRVGGRSGGTVGQTDCLGRFREGATGGHSPPRLATPRRLVSLCVGHAVRSVRGDRLWVTQSELQGTTWGLGCIGGETC